MIDLGEGEFVVSAWYEAFYGESLCITNFGRTMRISRYTDTGLLHWEQIIGTKYYSEPKPRKQDL